MLAILTSLVLMDKTTIVKENAKMAQPCNYIRDVERLYNVQLLHAFSKKSKRMDQWKLDSLSTDLS